MTPVVVRQTLGVRMEFVKRFEWLLDHAKHTLGQNERAISERFFGGQTQVSAALTRLRKNGQGSVDGAKLSALCRAVGVSTDWVLIGEGPQFIEAGRADSPATADPCPTRASFILLARRKRLDPDILDAIEGEPHRVDPGSAYWMTRYHELEHQMAEMRTLSKDPADVPDDDIPNETGERVRRGHRKKTV